jgi:predicted N-acetyltransferase YhbS
LKIRVANHSDRKAILNTHKAAFGHEKGFEIAKLVDDLLEDTTARPSLSLVAVQSGAIIGHILFTKVKITESDVTAKILAPLAVLPENQKDGVGQKLISEGLRNLKGSGVELVFVLGHPTYYPRCGFSPAGRQGLEAPYPIPEEHAEAWMVVELNGNHLGKIKGTVQCCKALSEPQHWRE